jgi:mannose-6-phosphate isomerase-like protein (cupin superfamily)
MSLKVVNVVEEASRLTEPFSLIEMVHVDYLAVDVFICYGAVVWHKHMDQDELFLVQSGAISLETEWGNLKLGPGELAVVPKGVGHRSSSSVWSVVLLFQPRALADRRNGDRRIFALKDERQIEKVSLSAEAARLLDYLEPSDLACLDDFVVRLSLCLGESHWHQHEGRDEFLFVQEGVLELGTEGEKVSVRDGEMTVVPKGVVHRLVPGDGTVAMLLERQVPIRGGR